MIDLLSPQIFAPVCMGLASAAGSYLVIIKKARIELAAQTQVALEAFHTKTAVADINDRAAFRAEQKAELQELRQKIRDYERENGEMVARLAEARAQIVILEARVKVLENRPG